MRCQGRVSVPVKQASFVWGSSFAEGPSVGRNFR
jgi:hypothetical protein